MRADPRLRRAVLPGCARTLLALAFALCCAAPALARGPQEDPASMAAAAAAVTQAREEASAAPDAAGLQAEVRAGEQADARIANAVAARLLRQPSLQRVTVAVNGGVVTLRGEVVADADRKLASDLAAKVDGVAQVVNQVGIDAALHTRLAAAFDQLQGKLLRVVVALPLLAVAIAIVWFAVWFGRRVGRWPLRWLRGHADNPYMDGLVRRVVHAAVVIIGLVLALNLLGATALVGAVLGSAGVIGLVVGFAFRDIAENYMAGVLLSLRRPFAPDDHLVIDKYEGKVIALTSRATLLMTLDGNQVSLPNSLVFKSVVTNYTANPKRRFDFVVPVDTTESLSRARDLGLAAIAGVDGVLADPAPSFAVDGYVTKGFDLRFFGWVDQRRNDVGKVRTEALREVRGAFAEARMHGPETVRYRAADAPVQKEPAGDTSVNRDIDAQLAAAQRASDEDMLKPQGSGGDGKS
ncbi:MAG: mechanosensitive ion channel domain-containing protein [Luteimonas sp.]